MMKKILYFVDRARRGGIQSFLKTICSSLPKNEFDISMLVLDDGEDYKNLENEYIELGVHFYKLEGIWLSHFSSYKKYKQKLCEFFSTHQFDIVHINSGPKNFIIAKIARYYGVKQIIYHSHNTGYQTKNLLKICYGNILKKRVAKYCSDYVACSFEAGQWMYSKAILNSNRFKVIHNPIHVKEFTFSDEKRDYFRKEFNLSDCFVIANIARLSEQKNQSFLLKIMKELIGMNSQTKLVFIGTGELEKELCSLSEKLDLSQNVLFLGFRNDVNSVINMADLIVMPSLFEGYPISAIEAQANGLPVLMSDTITKEAMLKENSAMLSLKQSPKEWAEYIFTNYIKKENSRVAPNNINEYSVDFIVKELCEIYNSKN